MRTLSLVKISMWIILPALLLSCQKPEPIRLGFVAGLSGRTSDLAVSGRNGVQLAVEQRNAAGGINGRPVELVVRDIEQNPDVAKKAVGELIGQGIELIIGPMTSSMAMAMAPQINASRSILLSPTATTTDLAGKDDNFLRVISTTTEYAAKGARYLYEKSGVRTAAVIYDIGNRSYTESWLNDFSKTFTALGGKVLLTRTFQSGKETVFLPLVQELLASRAGSVVIISNAIDAALICQQIRKFDRHTQITIAEWASTERFIELAGAASEGVVAAQFLNRKDSSQRYRDFLTAYRTRFKQEPGFAGVAGYDAAMVALEAHAGRQRGQKLKEFIIAKKHFQALQQPLIIDRFGDSNLKTFITLVKDGQYVTEE